MSKECEKISKFSGEIELLLLRFARYCVLKSYKRSEVEFRYNNSKDTKTFYHILLKMIRDLASSNASRS